MPKKKKIVREKKEVKAKEVKAKEVNEVLTKMSGDISVDGNVTE